MNRLSLCTYVIHILMYTLHEKTISLSNYSDVITRTVILRLRNDYVVFVAENGV